MTTITAAPAPSDDQNMPSFVSAVLEILRDPNIDPAFYRALSILVPMTRAERNFYLARINTFHDFDLEELAILQKYLEPELRDGDIADRLGVSGSTISRMDRYHDYKPSPDDWVNKRPRQSKRRVNRRGDGWEADHPGG
jgi:hypothetical protein